MQDELLEKIRKMEKEAEAARKKREWIVIACFSVLFFLFFYFDIKPEKFGEILEYALVAVFLAGLHVAIHQTIFDWLYSEKMSDQAEIDILKKKLNQDNTH